MEEIKKLVKKLKDDFCTSDPILLCRLLHFPVLLSCLPVHVKGFCLEIKHRKLIFINQDLPEWKQREVCAHELGHALLHDGLNTCFISYHTNLLCARYEKEADYFCACLLVDEEMIKASNTLHNVASMAGVHLKLVELRCQNN